MSMINAFLECHAPDMKLYRAAVEESSRQHGFEQRSLGVMIKLNAYALKKISGFKNPEERIKAEEEARLEEWERRELRKAKEEREAWARWRMAQVVVVQVKKEECWDV